MVSTDHGIYWLCQPFDVPSQLWTSKGTPESTAQVTLEDPQVVQHVTTLIEFKGKVLMPVIGKLYYYTPKTGRVLVKDMCRRNCDYGPANFVFIGNNAFFVVDDEVDIALWKSDLTDQGTNKFCNTTVCKALSTPTALGNQILFFNTAPTLTLYAINATDASVLLLKTFPGFALVSNMQNVITVSGKFMYFMLSNLAHPNCTYVFKSDGTVAGTAQYSPTKCKNVTTLAGGFLKTFSYSPNGTAVVTIAYQEVVVNSTDKSVTNVTSAYLTIYEPFTQTWINLAEMCTGCDGTADYSYFWHDYAWYFTTNGLHEIVYGKAPNFNSSASSLSPFAFLLMVLMGLMVGRLQH